MLPVFVKQGIDEPVAISSMPGVVQHTLDSLRKAAHEAAEAGIGGLMLFGIPGEKDPVGSQADAADGIVNVALQQLRADLGDELVLMADLCLCEYTDHGHCGVVTPPAWSTTTRPSTATRRWRSRRRRPAPTSSPPAG